MHVIPSGMHAALCTVDVRISGVSTSFHVVGERKLAQSCHAIFNDPCVAYCSVFLGAHDNDVCVSVHAG